MNFILKEYAEKAQIDTSGEMDGKLQIFVDLIAQHALSASYSTGKNVPKTANKEFAEGWQMMSELITSRLKVLFLDFKEEN